MRQTRLEKQETKMATFPMVPLTREGRVMMSCALDLTVYPRHLTMPELEFVLGLYQRLCPKQAWKFYKVAEISLYDRIDAPILWREREGTFLSAVKDRLQTGRRVELRIWDGEDIDSWSFHCYALPQSDSERHCFYRIMMPVDADWNLLIQMATEFGNEIEYLSGHGGFCFSYDIWTKELAFSEIYKKARRFCCIDIEDLNLTLPLVRNAIKGINWLTLVGNSFLEMTETNLKRLEGDREIVQIALKNGKLFIAGNRPVVGDRNRSDPGLEPYFKIGGALESIQLHTHPDFSGKFSEEGNTMAWFRRFVDPEGW